MIVSGLRKLVLAPGVLHDRDEFAAVEYLLQGAAFFGTIALRAVKVDPAQIFRAENGLRRIAAHLFEFFPVLASDLRGGFEILGRRFVSRYSFRGVDCRRMGDRACALALLGAIFDDVDD